MAVGEDANVLIEKSIRDGAKKHNSRLGNVGRMVTVSALFGAVGWLLAFEVDISGNPTADCDCLIVIKGIPLPVGWLGSLLKPIVLILGWLALAVAAVAAAGLVGAAFGADMDWGKKVEGDCPVCGRPSLREGAVSHTQKVGFSRVTRKGTVTVCADPTCEYAAAQGTDGPGSAISVETKPARRADS